MPENGKEIIEKVIRVSRERYTTPREIVENKILKWSGALPEDEEKTEQQGQIKTSSQTNSSPTKKKDGKLTQTKCDECGKEISVPFEPDGIRPVYCNECFTKIKKQKQTDNRSHAGPE